VGWDIRRISWGKKVSEIPISTNKLGIVMDACDLNYLGSIGGRLEMTH
jgi:hypothetical protein